MKIEYEGILGIGRLSWNGILVRNFVSLVVRQVALLVATTVNVARMRILETGNALRDAVALEK